MAEASRFNVVDCGRRFGKTTMGLNRIVPHSLAGFPCAWFAPTFKLLLEVWRDFRRILKPVTRAVSKQEKRIELVTGGSIEFWTLTDPDAGRSRKYKHVVIDEAAKARHLKQAWQESIRPTLTDYRGSADFLSTPKGRNFFWELYTRGQDPLQPEWMSWQMPTTTNPYIDPLEVLAAKAELPERVFAQEFLAEFLEEGGGVFRNVLGSIDKHRTANDPPVRFGLYTSGLDLARKEDFTVITLLQPDGRQLYHNRLNQVSWERQIQLMTDVASEYNDADIVMDSTGLGDPIFERLRDSGLNVTPYQFTNASKNRLIDNLALMLEQGKLRLMDLPVQTDELQSFEYELTKSRNVVMSAPEGMHDDCVISLALAAWGMSNTKYITVL